MDQAFLQIHNGVAFDVGQCPVVAFDAFRESVLQQVENGARIASFFAYAISEKVFRLTVVLALEDEGVLAVTSTNVGREYPSLTPDCPQAHWFEREIFEQWGVRPVDHPWLKPIRFQPRVREGEAPAEPRSANAPSFKSQAHNASHSSHSARREPRPPETTNSKQKTCGVTDFYQFADDEVHEVAVGPVHAGIIEPGHFRFQCHGEIVYHLEISLGYQHRGVERAVHGGPDRRTIHYMETLAGDTTVGHANAYCRAVEALGKIRVPARAQVIRGIAMELERIANHVGDLGALSGDVGFLPTMSYCGRIRGDVLNMTAVLCGNRFGRGLTKPGGVAFDLSEPLVAELGKRLDLVAKDIESAVELLWNTPSVMARFDDTGPISPEMCEEIGLVGVAARACGISRDVRCHFPYGIYRFVQIPVSTWESGDVFARAYVRWLEIQRSLTFIKEQLDSLPAGETLEPAGRLEPNRMTVALVEGWRGEICHTAITDGEGRFAVYKVVDPSFHNWFGLSMVLRNQQISDFPLCNKSFNLSYCGHDL
jgi:Ni,Fe-hydrogenase III large subunit